MNWTRLNVHPKLAAIAFARSRSSFLWQTDLLGAAPAHHRASAMRRLLGQIGEAPRSAGPGICDDLAVAFAREGRIVHKHVPDQRRTLQLTRGQELDALDACPQARQVIAELGYTYPE